MDDLIDKIKICYDGFVKEYGMNPDIAIIGCNEFEKLRDSMVFSNEKFVFSGRDMDGLEMISFDDEFNDIQRYRDWASGIDNCFVLVRRRNFFRDLVGFYNLDSSCSLLAQAM